MKKFPTANYPKSSLSVISATFLFFIIFSLASCARKLTFDVSPVVPAAEGTVKIKKSKNGNYLVNVKIKNLAGLNAYHHREKFMWFGCNPIVTRPKILG